MQEIIDLLKNNNIEQLCEIYKLEKFQAKMLCERYNRLDESENNALSMEVSASNQGKLKSEIVNSILTGVYLQPDSIDKMARKYIASKIEKSDDRITFLIEECGMSEDEIESFLEEYNKVCPNKNELTMASDFDSQNKSNELLNELVSIYKLNNQNSKKM